MNRPAMLPLIVAALTLAIAACARPTADTSELSEADVAAIEETGGDRTQGVILAEDWAAFAAMFTEDAIRMPPNEPLQVGRAAIEAWAAENWGPLTPVEYTQAVDEVEGRGDLAYARGHYTWIGEAPGVPEPIRDEGKFLVILRKQPDGSWLVSHSIYNSDTPPPPMGTR